MKSNEAFVKVLEGFEPFDLLRYSKDAFYDIVGQYFPNLTITKMELDFLVIEGEVMIEAKIIEYEEN
jgi:hypothetical protein